MSAGPLGNSVSSACRLVIEGAGFEWENEKAA